MIDFIGGKLLWILMFLLAGGVSFAGAAQPDKSKTTKVPPVVKEYPGPWLLAGREGECAPTSILAKGPEYNDISEPATASGEAASGAHKAEMKEFKAGTRPAVEVRAPSEA